MRPTVHGSRRLWCWSIAVRSVVAYSCTCGSHLAGLMYYNPAPRLLAAGLLEDADPSGSPLECDHMRIYIARDVLGMVLEKVHPGTPVRHVIW